MLAYAHTVRRAYVEIPQMGIWEVLAIFVNVSISGTGHVMSAGTIPLETRYHVTIAYITCPVVA